MTKFANCDSLVKSTYMNMVCKYFFADFQWLLSVKRFTGCYSGLISYLKTVLESWTPGQKSYQNCFSCFRLFHGKIIVWMLKLLSNTPKLLSKVRIAVQTSWLSCRIILSNLDDLSFLFLRDQNSNEMIIWLTISMWPLISIVKS